MAIRLPSGISQVQRVLCGCVLCTLYPTRGAVCDSGVSLIWAPVAGYDRPGKVTWMDCLERWHGMASCQVVSMMVGTIA